MNLLVTSEALLISLKNSCKLEKFLYTIHRCIMCQCPTIIDV